ncbi:hypothetical protein [Phyllobacterium sp. K27]
MNEKSIPEDDGRGLVIEILVHGGQESDNFPKSIQVTNKEGQRCVYVPLRAKKGMFAKIRDELNELFAKGSTRPIQ